MILFAKPDVMGKTTTKDGHFVAKLCLKCVPAFGEVVYWACYFSCGLACLIGSFFVKGILSGKPLTT